MSRYGEKPLDLRRVGLAGSNCVRFEVTIRHGRGTRRINVDVHAREILAMADAIRATKNQACTAPKSRTGYPQDDLAVGHAIWHLDNPDHPMPCIVGDIIDVEMADEVPRLCAATQGGINLPAADEPGPEPEPGDGGSGSSTSRSLDPDDQLGRVRKIAQDVRALVAYRDWPDPDWRPFVAELADEVAALVEDRRPR